MKYSLLQPLAFPLVFLALASFVAARPNGVSVTASSAQGCDFSVAIKADLSELQTVHLKDSTILLVKTVAVGIPPNARVRIASVEGRSPMAVSSQSLPQSLGPAGQPLASLSGPELIRGRQLVFVHVHPVQGMSVYTDVAIRLTFEGGNLQSADRPAKDPVFDPIFSTAVVNFDEWQRWPTASRVAAKVMAPQDDPFSHSDNWVKIRVNQTALVRISGADLAAAGVSLNNLASSSIRIFNAGGKPLAMQNSSPRPVFDEMSIIVNDGGDGLFGTNDQILFFGEPVDRFDYQPGQVPQYLNNPYCTDNIYWLTTGGSFPDPARRIQSFAVTPGGVSDTTVTTFNRRVHAEQDNVLIAQGGEVNDYYTWYWTDKSQLSVYVPTPGVVPGSTARVFLDGRTGVNSNGRYISGTVNGDPLLAGVLGPLNCTYQTHSLVDGLNTVNLRLTPMSSSDSAYFNFAEITYLSNLTPSGDKLDFAIDSLPRQALIQVQDNFGALPLLLDLGDPLHPIQDTGFSRQSGTLSFAANLDRSAPNRFYCATQASAIAPASIAAVPVNDLRADLSQADLIIVTRSTFEDALTPYVDYRRSKGLNIKVVTMDDIMDNFGFGLFDPTAIRDYLKFQYENAATPAPAAVLFVGDANYDILDHLGTGVPNYVPSYINSIEAQFTGATYSDDNYVYFGDYGILDSDHSFIRGDRGYDMLTARWPVRSSADIATIINKIETYDASTDFGDWRTVITLVADDEYGIFNNETFHTLQTEELEKQHIPPYFTRDKIYLMDYPFVNNLKPAVNQAIINAFDQGALVVNYVGHGNPDVWSHQRVFNRTTDLPQIRNADRLPLVFAASCAIGFFDDPRRQAMGEDFLMSSANGAVAVVSAMRLVFSSDNAAFNQAVYNVLMYNDSLSIDQAVYTGKLLRQYGGDTIPQRQDNDRAYEFFGDPFLRLGLPRLRMQFSQKPDSLTALLHTRVAGRVVDAQGQTVAKNGKLSITVFDSDRNKIHDLVNSAGQVTDSVRYTETGPSIFKGEATITNGNFDFQFIPPVDIGFGGHGAKVTVYAVLDTIDGIGLIDSIPVASQVAPQTDTIGPTVKYTFGGRQNFVSGDAVGVNDELEVTLTDSSGINLAGGLGHGITLEVDGRPDKTVNLTNLFAYDPDSYTSGKLAYSLSGLDAGTHSFVFRAWDAANNATTVQFNANLVAVGNVAIDNLLNYPNPMQMATKFFFELTQPVDRFVMDIFTLSGRKIRTFIGSNLPADNYPNGQFEIVWDGRDASGDRVATGVYIYKATAVPRNGGPAAQSYGKVVVVN